MFDLAARVTKAKFRRPSPKTKREGDQMNDNSIPWPKKGDQLFKSDIDWWHNACLNFVYDQWDLYAQGYKLAGDLLVRHVKDTQADQDTLVFPIVFLYRQYLELALKDLITKGSQLLDSPEDPPTHHKIDQLWSQCRRILEAIWPDGPSEDLDAVGECIYQFSEKDPSSMAFRYPTAKDGTPSVPGLKHINLRNLSEVMERISSLLEGSSIGIYEYLGAK